MFQSVEQPAIELLFTTDHQFGNVAAPCPDRISEIEIHGAGFGILGIDERIDETREGFEEAISRCTGRRICNLRFQLYLQVVVDSRHEQRCTVLGFA